MLLVNLNAGKIIFCSILLGFAVTEKKKHKAINSLMRQSDSLRNPTSKQLSTVAGAMLHFFFFLIRGKKKTMQNPLRYLVRLRLLKVDCTRAIVSQLPCQNAFSCTLLHEANFSQAGPRPTHST